MTIHFVRPDGSYVGAYGDGAHPSDADAAPAEVAQLVCLDQECPAYADQVWLFPGWSDSPRALRITEDSWRKAEMALIADQLLRLEDGDPTVMAGDAKAWRDYRIKLRAWDVGHPHFPDSKHRPVRPDTSSD